jgi:hypothetical protein
MIERIRVHYATALLVLFTSACSTTLAARPPEVTPQPSEASPATPETGSTIDTTSDDGDITAAETTAPTTPPEQDTQPSPSSTPLDEQPPTTTTTEPDVVMSPCVEQAQPDDTLESIAARRHSGSGLQLWAENGFVERVSEGELIDICAGNGLDDITGETRLEPSNAELASAVTANVRRQQTRLNELFAGSGFTDLDVDGVSGPLTGQRLCAARLTLGLPTTIADMAPGSNEQDTLFRADELATPTTAPIDRDRWVLIDRTCQVMFVGSQAETLYIFPTSTGSEGFETRDQNGADVFRYNPAIENGGWHNSSDYPVGVDNPLNGNLWKPLYFDLGQAIHGANYVPPTPDSKGCARLRLGDQALLLNWLGLDDVLAETWRKPEIDLAVSVQGEFVPRED